MFDKGVAAGGREGRDDAFDHTNDDRWDDPMGQAQRALAALGAEDRSGWSTEALKDRVRALAGLVERTRTELIRVTGELDAVADDLDGAMSTTGWLATNSRLSRGEARATVVAGRVAHRHRPVGDALASGRISADEARLLAWAAAGPRAALFAEHLDGILDALDRLGRRRRLEEARTVIRRWVAAANDLLDVGDDAARFDRRALHLTPLDDGMVLIRGQLDPEGGAQVLAALRAGDAPDPRDTPGGARTAAQRRADRLVDLARDALGERAAAFGPAATVDLEVDLQVLLGDTDPAALLATRDLGGVGPVGRSVIERLLCDSWIRRLLLGGPSEPLDLGRAARTFTPAQRRAVRHRDHGCVFAGCDVPADRCDVHHLVPWQHGGTTDLDNAACLHRAHHVACHEKGYTVFRHPRTGAWLTRAPDGRHWARDGTPIDPTTLERLERPPP